MSDRPPEDPRLGGSAPATGAELATGLDPASAIGEPLARAASWLDEGLGVALATVIATWGSSPRPAGSRLAVNERGAFVGSVSGGCIEAAVVDSALEVIADGEPRVLEFGVDNSTAWSVGLACGGTVRIFVDSFATKRGLLQQLLDDRARKRPVALATPLDGGGQILLYPGEGERPGDVDPAVWNAAAQALADGRCATVGEGRGGVFVQPQLPPLRMIIVGGVHIAQALAPLARIAGFQVAIVDPREAFASPQRFSGVELHNSWPDRALAALEPDLRTAVVTLTHDPKIDEPALSAALQSDAFYIAALGSRKTHAARLERLRARGVADSDLERIHGPAGLAIGARASAEIAVSILAQCIATLRRGDRAR